MYKLAAEGSSLYSQAVHTLLHAVDSFRPRGSSPGTGSGAFALVPLRLELAVPDLAQPALFRFFCGAPRHGGRVEVRVLLGCVEAGAAVAVVVVGRVRRARRLPRCTRSVSGFRETSRSNDGINTLLPLATRSPAVHNTRDELDVTTCRRENNSHQFSLKVAPKSCSCSLLSASTIHLCLSACSTVGRSPGLGWTSARMNALASSEMFFQYLSWLQAIPGSPHGSS